MASNRSSFRRGEFARGQAAGVAARQETARIRAGLADRTVTLAELLGGQHELGGRAERLLVEQLLRWCPGMGDQRVATTLREMQLSTAVRVHELDGAHRRALIAVANAYEPRRDR